LLATPFHALRFAGLFTVSNRTFAATGNILVDEAMEQEQENPVFSRGFSIHSLLACRNGTSADVCALLCSFFCGFGLEAYVCRNKVLTAHSDHATLWDPFTCQRQHVETLPTTVLYGYCCRLEPLVENPAAVTSDPRVWKRFELPPPISTPALLSCAKVDEEAIEKEVKGRVCEVRHTRQTRFDDRIAAAVRPLLHSYEASKLNESCDLWTPHVNDAIRHLIPSRSSIKVAPLCIHSTDGQSIFMALQAKASQFLHHPEAELFVVSLAVFPYAEDLAVSWCLFGVILPQSVSR
jgi:hypothetical protein